MFIYTIGYGGRKIDTFLTLLKTMNINTLIDIRSKPFSRFQPDYRKQKLSEILSTNGIEYLFMGDYLGGKPSNDDLYTNSSVDYDKIAQSVEYNSAIAQLIAISSVKTACIMCSELKQDECHRKNLVGVTLATMGLDVIHINEQGLAVPHLDNNMKLF